MRSTECRVIERDEFRVVTTFHPFERYDYHAQCNVTLADHKNVSLTYGTLESAEQSAAGMRSLHSDDGNVRVKEQRIEHRTVTDWTDVGAR